MSEAPRTEIEVEDDVVFGPAADREITPFAELSRLVVVGIETAADNRLFWKSQIAPNGPFGPKWHPIGPTSYNILSGGMTLGGQIAIVAQTSHDPSVHLLIADETSDPPFRNWRKPVDLGLPEGVTEFVQVAITTGPSGRMQIFGVDGKSGAVWWIYQNPDRVVEKTEEVIPPGDKKPITVHVMVPVPPLKPWSDWLKLDGKDVSRISLGKNADGRVVLFGTGTNPKKREVFRNTQTSLKTLKVDQWSGWIRMDNEASGFAVSNPVAVLDTNGAVNLFMIGNYGEPVQIWQDPPGTDTWTAWSRPGMIGTAQANLAVGFDGGGHISLVATDADNLVSANQQSDVPRQQWNGWQGIGMAPGTGMLAINYNADGRLSLFLGGDPKDALTCVSQIAVDSTSWEAGWTPLSSESISRYTVVRDPNPPGEQP